MRFLFAVIFSLICIPSYAQQHLEDFDYDLTDVGSEEAVSQLYDSLRSDLTYDPHRSNCYLRANVWAYQMLKVNQVKSGKVFLIYTWSPDPKSIATYGKTGEGWWFHVAPYVIAGGKEYVLEKFGTAKTYLSMEDWQRLHTAGSTCQDLNMPEHRDLISLIKAKESITLRDVPCYVRKAPMNYTGPQDVHKHDILKKPAINPEPELYYSCRDTIDRVGNVKAKCRTLIQNPGYHFNPQGQ